MQSQPVTESDEDFIDDNEIESSDEENDNEEIETDEEDEKMEENSAEGEEESDEDYIEEVSQIKKGKRKTAIVTRKANPSKTT